jgi:uncharacterized protein
LKFHQSTPAGLNAFTGYGDGYVLVNALRHESSILVVPNGPVRPWPVDSPGRIDAARIDALVGELVDLQAEVVLLGTGQRLTFLAPAVLAPLARARIGVEVMDTPAACRTYNILMAEGRKVAAALVVESVPPKAG